MIRWWIPYALLFATTLVVTLLTTPIAAKLAWLLGAIDKPSKRRINTKTTPRMGGIAIFFALACALAVQYVGTTQFGWPTVLIPSPNMTVNYHLLAVSFLIIFLTGALDDVFQLKPLVKLAGQIIAAAVAVASGLTIGNIVNPFGGGEYSLGLVGYPLTILYLVAYVNIINLIDGLDGLASGITFVASVTLFILAILAKRLDAAALSISVGGSTLGFLRYNFNPASIFLGDSGSLLLGFSLGVISLLSVTRLAGLTTIIIPLVIAFVPIMDTLSAIIRRKRANVSVSHADKGHIHHRLIAHGYNQKRAALLIYAWTAMLCAGAIVMTQVTIRPRIAIFCVLIGASSAFAMHLKLFEPVLRHHYNPKSGEDELVDPTNPAFELETKVAQERKEERREERRERISEVFGRSNEAGN